MQADFITKLKRADLDAITLASALLAPNQPPTAWLITNHDLGACRAEPNLGGDHNIRAPHGWSYSPLYLVPRGEIAQLFSALEKARTEFNQIADSCWRTSNIEEIARDAEADISKLLLKYEDDAQLQQALKDQQDAIRYRKAVANALIMNETDKDEVDRIIDNTCSLPKDE